MEPGSPPRIRPESPPTESGSRAQKEATAFANNDYERLESRKKHIHRGGLVVFWAVLMGVTIVAGAWLFHLVTPTPWHFLADAQLGELKNVLITAVGSSAATSLYRQWIETGKTG